MRQEVTPDNVSVDDDLPRYGHESSDIALIQRPAGDDDVSSVVTQAPTSNYSMVYRQQTLRPARPLPPIQAVPSYGELDLVSRKAHLDALDGHRAKMEGNLFTSSLTRLVATGGTVAGTVLGVLIGVKDGAHAYTQYENGQSVTVLTKPRHENLMWEVPLGLGIYLGFMTLGLYRQYSTRSKIKTELKNELKRSRHLRNEMFVLKRGNHPQREEIKEIIKTIDALKAKLGYTPGRDAWQITKGTALAVPITIGALGAIAVAAFACVLGALAASQGGCGDGFGAGPLDGCGSGGGFGSCGRGSARESNDTSRVPNADIEHWETVMDRPLQVA